MALLLLAKFLDHERSDEVVICDGIEPLTPVLRLIKSAALRVTPNGQDESWRARSSLLHLRGSK
jgi:hypothetical protein